VAQLAADGVSVLFGQENVQDYDVVLIDGGQIERLFAILCDVDRVGLLPESLGDESGDSGFVFHQQNAHYSHFARGKVNRQ
jgi:hypothetical protein